MGMDSTEPVLDARLAVEAGLLLALDDALTQEEKDSVLSDLGRAAGPAGAASLLPLGWEVLLLLWLARLAWLCFGAGSFRPSACTCSGMPLSGCCAASSESSCSIPGTNTVIRGAPDDFHSGLVLVWEPWLKACKCR